MSVTIWTTTNCNLKCKYCYEIKNKQRNLSSKIYYIDVYKLLGWIRKNELGKDRIMFHGGEPLLKFSTIKKVTEYLSKKKQLPERMGLTTNGMVWNIEIEQFFQKYKTLFEKDMSISIDGTEDMHNKCRRTLSNTRSYNKVIETQKKLINIFPELRARMTITPDYIDNFYDGIRNLVELGFKSISASLDDYDGTWTEEHMFILKEQLIKVIEFWKVNQNLRLPFIESIRYRRPKGKCKFSYNIYPNGDIYPCAAVTGMYDFCIGNVVKGLDFEKINKIRQKLNVEYDVCKSCNNIKYCIHNRCQLVNYTLTNNYTFPNILGCRIERIKFELEEYLSSYINYIT